jgi:hypothetical protein
MDPFLRKGVHDALQVAIWIPAEGMKKEMEGLALCPLHRKDSPALDCPVATDDKPSLVEKGDKLIVSICNTLFHKRTPFLRYPLIFEPSDPSDRLA